MTDMAPPPVGLVGMGYEGRTAEDLVNELVRSSVSRLVDIRLTPISRKRGLSKTALGAALTSAGIAYEHRPELGNPKVNRPGFAGTPEERERARAHFANLLNGPRAAAALDALADASRRERVVVLCFEADQECCHRDVVLQAAHRLGATVSGSRHQAR